MATFAEKAKQRLFTRSATDTTSDSSFHHVSSDGIFSTTKSKRHDSGPAAAHSSPSAGGGNTDNSGGGGGGTPEVMSRTNSLKALLRNPFKRSSVSSDSETDKNRLSRQSSHSNRLSGQTPSPTAPLPDNDMGGPKIDRQQKRDEVKKSKQQSVPTPGTFEYIVKEGDKLRSLAAQFDTTPSVLKKLNRLTMDFLYPGQVLRIPGEDYVALNTKPSPSTTETKPVTEEPQSPTADKAEMKFPGHVIRKDVSCHSIVDESEMNPRPLAPTEAEYLDQECFERFIKINSFYITEHHGSIDGVLLVTPNAVMFDPDVSNPLVIEMGAEEFGMIAKMDTIMSAAIYHDLDAMKCLQQRKKDPTIAKPEVYRAGDSTCSNDNLPEPTNDTQPGSPQLDSDAAKVDPKHSGAEFTIGDSIDSTAMILNVSSLSQIAELDVPTQAGKDQVDSTANNTDNTQDLSRESQPLSSQSCAEGGDTKQAEQLIDINDNSSSHVTTSSPQVETATQAESGSSTQQCSTPAVSSTEGQSATSTGEKGSIIPTSPSQPHAEFALVEYDLVNSTRKFGNSQFYSVVPEVKFEGIRWRSSSGDLNHAAVRPPVKLTAGVKFEDRPQLFQSLNDMIPNGLVTDKQSTDEPSLYLCLKIGQPINKSVSADCPIELYSKKKRPEYWFTVPRDKVDKLYAFFIQWKSEVYDSDDMAPTELGFIAIREEEQKEGTEESSDVQTENAGESPRVRHQLGRQFTMDWEIVSIEEIRRRKELLDIEKYIPLPELTEKSLILTEIHIKQLAKSMPARVEGYPWALSFGSEQHGFSLSQMYRNLLDIESPVLLVIETTNNEIFGAMSSCAFHTSDHFYGTGESFLFTFVDGFKIYPWSGKNNFFNKGDTSCLSVGSGKGSYGIWLDGDLYLGRTLNCETYANDPLTLGKEDFHIKQIEVWSFHDDL